MANVAGVSVSSREFVPYLSDNIFNGNKELAFIVLDYCPQSVTVDSVTSDVARRHFRGNRMIADLIVDYNCGFSFYGLSPEYQNIADNVQSNGSAELLTFLSDQIASVDSGIAGCREGGTSTVRKACVYVLSNVEWFDRNSTLHGTRVTEVARLALTAINLLHPLNEEDPCTQEEIPFDDMVMTFTGNRFSVPDLVAYHNTRGYKGSIGEHHERKFLLNPLVNTAFPWLDVPPLIIAAARYGQKLAALTHSEGEPIRDLNRDAVVPEGSGSVYGWHSLSHFYVWMQSIAGLDDHAIYERINDVVIAERHLHNAPTHSAPHGMGAPGQPPVPGQNNNGWLGRFMTLCSSGAFNAACRGATLGLGGGLL